MLNKGEVINYNPKLKQRAREMRNNSTLAEVLLWQYLKGKKMHGYAFHRQKPIGNYIVDFFSPKLMLAIEIDGVTHGDKSEKDEKRQKDLENMGVRFLRFSDSYVKKDMNGVLRAIGEWICDTPR